MNNPPRVAFFTDSFHEVNGVAHTSRNFDAFARRRQLPFLNVHAGPQTQLTKDGPVWTVELKRSPVGFGLEHDMSFDLLLMRYRHKMAVHLKEFGAQLVHVTGPSDIGILGVFLAHQLGLPLIASWHTNIHEFGARRMMKTLSFLPHKVSNPMAAFTERKIILALTVRYYQLARVLLAPNLELVNLLREQTRKPTFLMQRGVDTDLFSPEKRDRADDVLTIGFVGRLSPEKSVRALRDVALSLQSAGVEKFRIVVVGDGHERGWLQENVPNVELKGLLYGEDLARAYAGMDIFAFPSHTDTFGNVVLESLASGVPVVVTASGGPKYLVMEGVTGFVAQDHAAFLDGVVKLAKDPDLRERMRVRARDFALCRYWNRIFDQVYDAYEYCLQSRKSVPLRPPVFA
jgi:glycosyltransferase involved in cell wall biosynthesis